MSSAPRISPPRREGGSLLIEVLVAAALLALLLTVLADAVGGALDRSEEIVAGYRDDPNLARDTEQSEAWQWGPQVSVVTWQPGPVLAVTAEGSGSADRTVGVWIDGWLLEEYSPADDGQFVIPAAQLRDRAGAEVVLRARGPDSPWGPPWRSVVPSPGVTWEGLAETPATLPETTEFETEAVRAVLHVANLANPAVECSGTVFTATAEPGGAPWLLEGTSRGLCTSAVDGHMQLWWAEGGRELDVYY